MKDRHLAIMDFPTAWAFVAQTKREDHDPQCSWVVSCGGFLCDCHVLNDEYERRKLALKPDGPRNARPDDLPIIQAFADVYDHRGCWMKTTWLGKVVAKPAYDLWTYQEVLTELRPDVLLETGTSGAGSAVFFATIFDLLGHGHVVTVDIDVYPHLRVEHPRITYLVGDSTSPEIIDQMAAAAAGKKTFVTLDSLHTYDHVRKELQLYGRLVSVGSYMVVEDVGVQMLRRKDWAGQAIVEYLAAAPESDPLGQPLATYELDDTIPARHLASTFKWLLKTAAREERPATTAETEHQ